MAILDREAERSRLGVLLKVPDSPSVRVIRLSGGLGVGKSALLRYAASQMEHEDGAFLTSDGRSYISFQDDHSGASLDDLEPIVGALAVRHPQLFASATSDTSLALPALPKTELAVRATYTNKYTKAFGDAFEPETRGFADARTSMLSLTREPRIAHALCTFITAALRADASGTHRIFILDNVQNVAISAMRVLLSSFRALRRHGHAATVVCAENEPASNTASIEDAASEYHEVEFIDFPVSTLDRDMTHSIIRELIPELGVDNADFFFHATSGNFADIIRFQRAGIDQVQVLYENWKHERSNVPSSIATIEFWRDHMEALLARHPDLSLVFELLLATDNITTADEMRQLCSALEPNASVQVGSVHSRLSPAIVSGDLQIVGDHVIADRRALAAMQSILVEQGRLVSRMRQIGDAIASRPGIRTTSDYLTALRVFSKYDHARALELVDAIATELQPGAPISSDLLALCIDSSTRIAPDDIGGPEIERLNALLQLAFRSSQFQEGARAGRLVVQRRGWLDTHDQYLGLFAYLSCLREAGQLQSEQEDGRETATTLLASATTLPEKIYALLLCASVYEHLHEHAEIQKAFSEIKRLLGNHESREPLLWRSYRRNLGLYRFHGDVIDEYTIALSTISDQSDDPADLADRASLLNHLGLGYYHTGQLAQAEETFCQCEQLLQRMGRRLETPWNNLGACKIVEGNPAEALTLLERAREYPIKPRYQSLSIEITYAICIALLGNPELAMQLLRPVADAQTAIPDPAILSHARANLAFCLMQVGEHLDAAKYYRLSNEHRFRFLTDERALVRTLLARFNAAKGGAIAGEDLGDMSYVDLACSGVLPVRRPYQLDLNSLYVI